MEIKTTEVDGIRMRWEEVGQGQPVIFLHGIPTCPRLWRHVIPKVSSAHCLAWEMVGYGASMNEGKERDISVSRQADYLIAWMHSIGLENAVLVGHDLGAAWRRSPPFAILKGSPGWSWSTPFATTPGPFPRSS